MPLFRRHANVGRVPTAPAIGRKLSSRLNIDECKSNFLAVIAEQAGAQPTELAPLRSDGVTRRSASGTTRRVDGTTTTSSTSPWLPGCLGGGSLARDARHTSRL